ncbi:MAG: BatD family protein [Nitrospirota bacterium]
MKDYRKRHIKAVIKYLILAVIMISSAADAGEINFQASIDSAVIYIGQSAQLQLQFQGSTDIPAPGISSIDGFQIRYAGPSTMMSIVNGRMSSSVTHIYRLMPIKTGKFQIGPFSFQHEGDTYKSNSLTVEVLDSASSAGGRTEQKKQSPETVLGDRIFVKMIAGKRSAYVNETIPLTIKLYVSGIGVRDIQYPEFDREGFSGGQFDKPGQYRETVGGSEYEVVEFRTGIFAAREGSFTLGPARIKANVVSHKRKGRRSPFDNFFGQDPFDDFFGGYEAYPVELKSKAVSLKVLPLPGTGRPADFKGALGNFKFDLEVSPDEVKAGDPITLKMIVSGSGNLDSVTSPSLKQHDGFKSYEPQARQEGGRKIFEQVLIPTADTVKEVPQVSFSFFNTDRGEYQTIVRGGTPLKVLKSDRKEEVTILDSTESAARPVAREKFGRDIIYIKESPGSFMRQGGYLYKNPIFLVLQIVPVLAYFSLWVMHRRKERLSSDVSYARRLSAPRKASKGIRETENFLAHNKTDEFYDAVFRTLREYIGNRFHVPSGGITADSVSELLRDNDLPQDSLLKLINILRECDMARYAPSEFSADRMQETMKGLKEIIDSLERYKG